MLISYNWLKEFIEISESPQEIADILTLLGLEVEGIEEYVSVLGGLKGVIVGEVLESKKHPNADKLSVCQVNIGKETVQIVCGAPNVAAGQKVPVALPGTWLYPENNEKNKFKLKKTKIRGEISYGMICSEKELGIGESHEGIMVLDTDKSAGTPLDEVVQVYKDFVFEIGLTPNRTDAMSHLGVARDLAAKLNRKIKYPNFSEIIPEGNYENPVTLEVPSPDCPYYAGVVIKNLPPNHPTPQKIKNHLNAVGQKSINFYVDLTNYSLLGVGQPLHAFDLDKIQGQKIIVRNANKEIEITTLDGKTRKALTGDLLICDEKRPLVFAGILGAVDAEVSETTTNLFIESAYFNPVRIRKTRKRLDVQTESAFRFERGTDPTFVPKGLQFFLLGLKKVFPDLEYSNFSEIKKEEFTPKNVEFSFTKAEKIAGTSLNKETVKGILKRLEMEIIKDNGEELLLAIPPYRRDVERFVDVLEEVLRVIGYNEIPETSFIPVPTTQSSEFDALYSLKNKLIQRLVGKGWQQVLNNSLMHKKYAEKNSVFIANPLGEAHSIMRPSMIFGGLENLAFSFNRQINALKIFEIGKTYRKNASYEEKYKLAFWVASKKIQLWDVPKKSYDFFTLKEIVYILLAQAGIKDFEENLLEEDKYLAYGLHFQTPYNLDLKIGQVRPSLTKEFGLKVPVYYGELNFYEYLKILKNASVITYTDTAKFPAVEKDISMLVPKNVRYEDIVRTLVKGKVKFIENISLFDYYQPDKNTISYAIRIRFRSPKRTLKDEEVNKQLQKSIELLESRLKVKVRKQ